MIYTQGRFMCKGDYSKHFTFHGGPSWTTSPNILVFFMYVWMNKKAPRPFLTINFRIKIIKPDPS